jgi:hypothetical protein
MNVSSENITEWSDMVLVNAPKGCRKGKSCGQSVSLTIFKALHGIQISHYHVSIWYHCYHETDGNNVSTKSEMQWFEDQQINEWISLTMMTQLSKPICVKTRPPVTI